MAVGLTIAQTIDLVTTTLNHIPKGSLTKTLKYNNYAVCDNFFGSNKIDADGGSGGHEWRIQVDTPDTARGALMYGVQSYRKIDVLRKLFFPWVITEDEYLIDKYEVARNRGSAQIINLVTVLRDMMYQSFTNYVEKRGMIAPDDANDVLNPWGILFHVRQAATGVVDPIGGFNGYIGRYLDGSTTNLVGGLDASLATHSRLRNWCATYNGSVITPQLIRTMRTAANRVNFRPPSNMKVNMEAVTQSKFCIYWSQFMAESYADYVNAGPDDRNGNASPFNGDLPFGSVMKTRATAVLDGIANNPIIGVNHQFLKPIALSGEWMLEDKPFQKSDQRSMVVCPLSAQWCIANHDPRRHFILHNPN